MAAFTPNLFRTISRYAGKIRTMRDDMRTKRLMNSLPAQHSQRYWLARSIHGSPHRRAELQAATTGGDVAWTDHAAFQTSWRSQHG